jgi:hypothetical protein
MAHTSPENATSPVEAEFNDLIRHADDFFKIELLRQAKSWYQKALKFNIETGKVEHQIAECDRLLAYENKIVMILGAIAIVLAVVSAFVW